MSAEGAPFKVSIQEAQEIVKKCPEMVDGPHIETEGTQFLKYLLVKTTNVCFHSGQVALRPSSKVRRTNTNWKGEHGKKSYAKPFFGVMFESV